MPAPRPASLAQSMQRLAHAFPPDPTQPRFELSQLFLSLAQSMPDAPAPAVRDEGYKRAERAVEAVRAIRRDELKLRYAVTEKTLKPASYPLHYDRLVQGVELAARGIRRPWWKRFFGIW